MPAKKKAAVPKQPPVDNEHVEEGAEKFSSATVNASVPNVYRADMGESLPPQKHAGVE